MSAPARRRAPSRPLLSGHRRGHAATAGAGKAPLSLLAASTSMAAVRVGAETDVRLFKSRSYMPRSCRLEWADIAARPAAPSGARTHPPLRVVSASSVCYNAAAMAWYHRVPAPKLPAEQRKARMEWLWTKCDGCGEVVCKQDVEKNLEVCPKCDEHFPLPVRRRLELVLDPGSFAEHDIGLESTDPLQFSDSKRYRERIKASQKSANEGEAFISGIGRIAGREISIGAFHFGFMGGSMGSVVGEKVTRVFERATDRRLPAIIFSASGGARMQEAIFSLMQMAKSSAALARFRHVQKPYISVLLDPTTGGVAASFAFLGDVILAEPRALIGFAGPRVIEQTIRQTLPEGFQRSEFLLKHGMIDAIVHRKEMREKLSQLLGLLA